MNKYKKIITGLDIGSERTRICIGGLDAAGRIEVYNAAMVKTRGLDRGIVTDVGEVAGCIQEAVAKIHGRPQNYLKGISSGEKKNIKIQSVYATIGGEHIIGNNTKGMISLSVRAAEIERRDVNRAIESAKYLTASIDRQIIHALPQDFFVDGYRKIKDPLGLFGTRLGVNLHIISSGLSFLNNMIKAINRAGLDVDGIVYSGFATSLTTLTQQEKQAGVVLLEIGAATTNILFFNEQSLQYTNVIAIGGSDITEEIARSIGIDFLQAEELKMQYKNICLNESLSNDYCEQKIIIKKGSAQYESITSKDLAAIVDKKMNEIIFLIKKDLELAGIKARAKRVVLCGGVSFMDGVIERIEESLRLPVSLGIVRGFVSSMSGISNIFYATSIGLLMHAFSEQGEGKKKLALPQNGLEKIISCAKSIYEEYF
ncbi:MAG: cell division protein FtsA [Candidatus Omnitrophica bacterium]|nr:cell division protein FtsA [Candidatus Omnitrophota bacterium]